MHAITPGIGVAEGSGAVDPCCRTGSHKIPRATMIAQAPSEIGQASYRWIGQASIGQTRAVAACYDKGEFVCRGTIAVASIRIWLRDPPESHSRDTALYKRPRPAASAPAINGGRQHNC
jgi:hypothetical protein